MMMFKWTFAVSAMSICAVPLNMTGRIFFVLPERHPSHLIIFGPTRIATPLVTSYACKTLDAGHSLPGVPVGASQEKLTVMFEARSKLDPVLGEEKEATVVLVGMPFAGKSSIGNMLAYGDPTPTGGFPVHVGLDSPVATCERRTSHTWEECTMTIVDTPRVPSRNLQTTLKKFDEIVTAVRRLPSVTALVFVQNMQRYEERDYQTCRVLLRQFSKLPCPIIMVCRVDTSSCPEHVKRRKEELAMALLQAVAKNCDLGTRLEHKYLYRHGEDARGDVKDLRWLLLSMPEIPMPKRAIATSAEVEGRLSRLSNENEALKTQLRDDISLLQKLKEKLPTRISELNSSVERRKRWLKILRILRAPLVWILMLFFHPSYSRTSHSDESQLSRLEEMKRTVEGELESVIRDLALKNAELHRPPPEELLRVREEYEELRGLGAGA